MSEKLLGDCGPPTRRERTEAEEIPASEGDREEAGGSGGGAVGPAADPLRARVWARSPARGREESQATAGASAPRGSRRSRTEITHFGDEKELSNYVYYVNIINFFYILECPVELELETASRV